MSQGKQSKSNAAAGGSLLNYMRLITAGGCLAMVFVACVNSPIATDFLRELGATEFQFGLLGGIPMILLFLQFVGGYISGRVPRRKPLFMIMLIAGRLLYLPAAFLPLFLTNISGQALVYIFIFCAAMCGAMNNFATPLWFSWMGDLIPRRILNRYWAERHRALQWVWTMAYLAVAGYTFLGVGKLSPRTTFPLLATIGVVAGVVDIILFTWVKEPPNHHTGQRRMLELLTEPLRNREFRTMVFFHCYFSASTILAASFMQIYALRVLGLPVWQATMIWCMVGLGSVFIARMWGRLADRFGHRPILLMCVAFKPMLALVFLLVTQRTALPVLAFCFFFDSMANAGYFIAVNGYKLKMAPRENRSMYIAATMALSGIAAGMASIAGGALLKSLDGFSMDFGGRTWINYHVIFLISFILRLTCIPLATRIRETNSASTAAVLAHMRGQWPLRMFLYPVGLYRSHNSSGK